MDDVITSSLSRSWMGACCAKVSSSQASDIAVVSWPAMKKIQRFGTISRISKLLAFDGWLSVRKHKKG